MNNNLEILDLLTIMSFILQVKNLEENDKQTKALEQHLKKQDEQYQKIIELLERSNNEN